MSTATPTSAPGAARSSHAKSPAERFFYPAAALLMLALMLIGFRHFFFHGQSHPGRDITPPIRTVIIAHGVAMAGWVVLLCVQTMLVASRKVRIHMMLGRIGAVFALGVFLLGIKVGIDSARVSPPDLVLWTLSAKQFTSVTLWTAVFFAAFVGVGVWKRKRPEIHKPMMLLATLAAMAAAVSRIDVLANLYVGTALESIFGPYLWTMVIGLLLVIVKSLLSRSLDRWLAGGWAVLSIAVPIIMALARTSAWDRFAGWLIGSGG